MIPDIEPIVRAYLLTVPEIEAIIGDRVGDQSPKSVGEPWVRITMLPDTRAGNSTTDHLVHFNLQLDCFAGQDAKGLPGDCPELALLVRQAMSEIERHSHSGAVISGCRVSHRQMPLDEDFEKPMVRYMVMATVYAHGVEEVGS